MDDSSFSSRFEDEISRSQSAARIEGIGSGGAHCDSYEKYVRKIFTPGDTSMKTVSGNPMYRDIAAELASGNPIPNLPPSLLLKMERLDEGTDSNGTSVMFSPLEMMHDLYSRYGIEDKPFPKFPVYQTKSSAEYFSIMNNNPTVDESPAFSYKIAKTATSPNIYGRTSAYDSSRYRMSPENRRFVAPESPREMTLDYSSLPYTNSRSRYLYPRRHHDYHNEDSRILGSNFVMLNLRPPSAFFARVDQTLADARALKRII